MTPAQCRAARALVGMTQPQLGFVAVMPLGIIIDFEAEAMVPRPEDLDALQDAFERAGVDFIGDVGVKLGKGAK